MIIQFVVCGLCMPCSVRNGKSPFQCVHTTSAIPFFSWKKSPAILSNLFSPLKEVHALCCRVKNIAAVTKTTLNFDTKVNQWSWCFPFGFENDHTKLALVKYPIDFNRCAVCQSSSSTVSVRRLDIHILTWVVSTMCEVFYEYFGGGEKQENSEITMTSEENKIALWNRWW